MNTKRLITFGLGCVMLASPGYLAAQQGDESVADAARKAQAEKKTDPKPSMVFDNDSLENLKGTISVVGQDSTTSDDQTKAGAEGEKSPKAAGPADETAAKDETYWRQAFVNANKKLADDAHELDILQREYNLKQEQYYTDPMQALKQDYSRQDLIDGKAKIDEKTAAVAQDKTDLSNLEDELRKAGGDPGWENPPQQ